MVFWFDLVLECYGEGEGEKGCVLTAGYSFH